MQFPLYLQRQLMADYEIDLCAERQCELNCTGQKRTQEGWGDDFNAHRVSTTT